jgi:uncharacterized membrane protein (TIGR02234 family)
VATEGDSGAKEGAAHGRRRLLLAVLGCLAGAAVVLVSSGATWVSARVSDGSGSGAAAAAPLPVELTGGTLAPVASALGLMCLAAAVAVIATRRLGRTVVGLLVAAAGVGIVLVAGRLALDPLTTVRATSQVHQLAPGGDARIRDLHRSAAPWLSCLGGLLLAVTGAAVAARGRTWPGMTGRYQARAATPADAWDAIERGQDPT